MAAEYTAPELLAQLSGDAVKMGDLKKLAKAIKRDHELGMALWASGEFYPRMLAVLIFDKRLLSQEVLDGLADDLGKHPSGEREQITDWLLANQLMKDKKTVALLESWENAASPVFRRLFWYHQARLRWTGQTPPDNTAALMESLESNLEGEEPEVQWTMNFTAGWIGIHQPEFRQRCVALGERLGLYKDEPVSRGCTPAYLPAFIEIEVAKRAK